VNPKIRIFRFSVPGMALILLVIMSGCATVDFDLNTNENSLLMRSYMPLSEYSPDV